MVLDRSNTGIVGSSPAQGTDECPQFSVLFWTVQVDTLRQTDLPPKDSYQSVQKNSQFRKLILNRNIPQGIIRGTYSNYHLCFSNGSFILKKTNV